MACSLDKKHKSVESLSGERVCNAELEYTFSSQLRSVMLIEQQSFGHVRAYGCTHAKLCKRTGHGSYSRPEQSEVQVLT